MDDDGRFMVASVDAIILSSVDAAMLVVLRGGYLETSFKSDVLVCSLRCLIIVSTCFCCWN